MLIIHVFVSLKKKKERKTEAPNTAATDAFASSLNKSNKVYLKSKTASLNK